MIPPDLSIVLELFRIRQIDACRRERRDKVANRGRGIWGGRIERDLFGIVPVASRDAVPLEDAHL